MDPRIQAWWDAVVAGEKGDPHPIFGDRISVRVARDRLKLSGELDRREDRDELLAQARARVGHGIRDVDASRLRVAERPEKPGLLDQTLIASFPNRATAELARKFVVEHSRAKPKREAVIDRNTMGRLSGLLPADLVADAKKHIDSQEALLVISVDETDAFRVRALLEEETRSRWTIAAPPEVAARG